MLCAEVAKVTIINLPGCLHCGANPMLLLKLETASITGNGRPPTLFWYARLVAQSWCGLAARRVDG